VESNAGKDGIINLIQTYLKINGL